MRLYCSNYDEKVKLVFDIYDFNCDGFITKDDISIIFNLLPVINWWNEDNLEINYEGKFTKEGGGLDNFE